MGDVKKKWCVTYTKHLNQKRKVYQDGFLELQSSSHKAMLYDDCEKLLGIKILKNNIDVKEGETLAFDSYLVDIGDPHSDYKPIPILNTKQIKKETQEYGLLHSGKSSTAADNRKSNLCKRKALPSSLSPSQKIIREFKKSEVRKYSSSPGSVDMTKSSTEEWQVLYTAQMAQKAKKFHDGYLLLVISSSHCKQIMLYDATRRLLDSRFLKKNESITSGQSVTFDGHLVEIGEREEDQKPPKDISPQRKHTTQLGERGPIHGEAAVDNKLPAEWDVMYTTQITQKAKKYSNGILKLTSCGSYQSQVTLLTEDGITLCRRFLKLSEHVTTGTTLNLPNYLVEVGDMRTSPEGKPQNDAYSQQHAQSDIKISGLDNIKLSRRISFNKPIPNRKPQSRAFSLEHVDSKTARVDNTTSCRISGTNSVRAAHEILSILKKPITSEGVVTVRGSTYADECQLLRSSGLVCSVIKRETEEHLTQDFNAKDSSPEHKVEETTMTHRDDRKISKMKVTDAFHLDGISHPSDCADQRVSHTHLLGSSTGLEAVDIFSCDVECTVAERRSPTAKLKQLAVPKSDSKVQTVEILCHNRSNEISEIENASTSVFHQDNPIGSVPALTDGCTLTHASNKPSADNKQTYNQWQEGFSGVMIDASNDSAPQFRCDSTEIKSEHDISASKMDDFPSFDLGF
ncbi:hypothetical protein K7X08_013380 [Anisodus acutangulus]|uniref:5'-3' DNA helicase ZGRF1-like N-terminal domain-containing protein n=1 Tax=Anisodus acutangulus TaxID=402998 RepID=A0A9Q1MBG0_9SOLA|nr:hypothetical protein K7X08_013380 [Anisodus acutangulus]